MLRRLAPALLLASIVPSAAACVAEDDLYDGETVKTEDGKDDSSAVALFVDFEFDGEVFTDFERYAQTSLDRGYVPLSVKDYVRDYFSSLDPSN